MKTRAMVIVGHGGPEVLEEREIDVREPAPGEVRVRVRAVALNHMDLWVRRGGPAFRVELPHRLGCDVVGDVEAVGGGVTNAKEGDAVVLNPGISCGVCRACLAGEDNFCRRYRILGEHTHGGYGGLLVVPAANLVPRPPGLTDAEAAAFPLTFLTAWQMLVRRAALRAGEVVLVHGAGSGVGIAAIAIAKLLGARVIATAGSRDKVEKALALGAEHGIDYAQEDFVARVKELTGKRGVDVVFEHVGGDVFAKSVLATASGGRIVTCGATAGFEPKVDLRHVFFRQISVLGSTMGSKADLIDVAAHVARGALRPVVDRVLPLREAALAHDALETRNVFGKVVLTHD